MAKKNPGGFSGEDTPRRLENHGAASSEDVSSPKYLYPDKFIIC